jgi:hypothetical protein
MQRVRACKEIILGLKSQMTKFEAREALQREITKQLGQPGSPTRVINDGSVTLGWFVNNRFLPLKEAVWKEETAKTKKPLIQLDVVEPIGDVPLVNFDKFSLQLHLNKLATTRSKDRVLQMRAYIRDIFAEAVDQDFLIKDPARKLKVPAQLRTTDTTALTWDQLRLCDLQPCNWNQGSRKMIRQKSIKLIGGELCAFIAPVFAYAFSIPDSVLIQRLQANRTHYARRERKQSLRKLALTTNKDISSNPGVLDTPAINPNPSGAKLDPRNHPEIKHAASHCDVIVIGTVTRNLSSFTENEGFIFTDSELLIEKVLAQAAPEQGREDIAPGSEITVTSPGGIMVASGHKISSFLPGTVPLNKNGRYILFLKYIPASQSYKRVDLQGYDITNPTVLPLQTRYPNPLVDILANRDSVIDAVSASSSKVKLNSREMR